jgi:16S rRNA (adenine1518-N6/adenine1519-N6)-dimethyltransferase
MDHVLGYRLDGRCTATLPTPTGQGAVLDLTPAHIQSGHGTGAMAHPRKALGQHFLSDRNILAAIADAASVGSADLVVEVGPGTGSLTEVLAARARHVIAVELDAALAGELAGRMLANVEIHTADARRVDVEALLGGCSSYKLLGNLPYYAAMPILRRFLESRCRPQEAVVLLQREVAQQVCATPGRMSLASLAVQLYGTPRIVRWVRPGAFRPPPKVTSAVVHIEVRDSLAEGVDDAEGFFRVARAGFSAPRKQLRNALAQGLAVVSSVAEALLAKAGIDPRRRAETLSLAEWAGLHRAWRT